MEIQNIVEKLLNYFLFNTLWIIQLYSLLYGLNEVLNKKIQTISISCLNYCLISAAVFYQVVNISDFTLFGQKSTWYKSSAEFCD